MTNQLAGNVKAAMLEIIKALMRFSNAPVEGLQDRIMYQSTRPSYELFGQDIASTKLNGVPVPPGLREFVRRWLQANGYAESAKELEERLSALSQGLKSWEEAEYVNVQRKVDELSERKMEGEVFYAIDYFSEDAREEYENLTDEAHYLADYVLQLSAMIAVPDEDNSPTTKPASAVEVLPEDPAPPDPPEEYVFQKPDELWDIRFGDERGRFNDSKGMRIILEILSTTNPPEGVSALDLQRDGSCEGKTMLSDDDAELHGLTKENHSFQPAQDNRTITEIRNQISDTQSFLENAQESGALKRCEELENEIQRLNKSLLEAQGYNSREKTLNGTPVDAARIGATNNIKRAIKKIEDGGMPKCAAHFAGEISTGIFCKYDPISRPIWEFSEIVTPNVTM